MKFTDNLGEVTVAEKSLRSRAYKEIYKAIENKTSDSHKFSLAQQSVALLVSISIV